MTFEEQLKKDGLLVYTNKGVSMMPLLREDRDIMVIRAVPDRAWKKYDAVLFMRPQVEGRGRYVLHRILRVNPDGTYWIVGDHCTSGETVREENILGVMESVIRGKRTIRSTDLGYRIYVHLWCDFYPVRCMILRGKAFARRCGSYVKRRVLKL